MRKFSLLGLVLIGASAVTAAVLPKDETASRAANALVPSTDGNANGYTCTFTVVAGDPCTRTATGVNDGTQSRTTTDGDQTSSITTTGGVGQARTRTEADAGRSIGANVLHSSFSPA